MLPRMQARTHQHMSARLVGTPVTIEAGRAVVELHTNEEMRADATGLVHGGFVFGLADYAAMLAINEPTVVLGSADVHFTAPVSAGQVLVAEADALTPDGKKLPVRVDVRAGDTTVLSGTFVCFVPSAHVLAATSESP